MLLIIMLTIQIIWEKISLSTFKIYLEMKAQQIIITTIMGIMYLTSLNLKL